jgi:hypothetical protein
MPPRHCLPTALLLAIVLPAAAADAPYAIVIARTSATGGDPAPVTVAIDFTAVAEALGLQVGPPVLPLVACRELPDGTLEPVASQFDPAQPGSGAGELTLLLPASAASQRVRVYFAAQRPAMASASAPGLQVTEEGNAIAVGNPYYRLTHDRGKQGGLPSAVQFVGTGKLCDTFALNDRVYNADLGGGYRLGDDRNPSVEVLSRGPLRAAIRVRARYLQGEKAPPSNPRAEYVFIYYAASPLVRIHATMTQDGAQTWPELHLWEFNTPDQCFTRWLTGKPPAGDALKADQGSYRGGYWGALAEGHACCRRHSRHRVRRPRPLRDLCPRPLGRLEYRAGAPASEPLHWPGCS